MSYDDIDDDYKHEQRYFNSLSSLPNSTDTMIARYWKGWDGEDIVYVDRKTGQEVLRYDGGDPANTNPFYGATADCDIFSRKGLNIKEMIERSYAIPDSEIASRMQPLPYGDYDDDYDDYDYE